MPVIGDSRHGRIMASSDIPSRRKVNTIGGPPPGKGAEERGQSALAHLRCTKAAGEGPGRGTPFDLRARNTDSGFPKAPGPRLLRCQFSLQDIQAYLQWGEYLDSELNIPQIFQSCSSSKCAAISLRSLASFCPGGLLQHSSRGLTRRSCDGRTGSLGNYSVRRRVLVATISTRLGFP